MAKPAAKLDLPDFAPDPRPYPAVARYVKQLSDAYVNGSVLSASVVIPELRAIVPPHGLDLPRDLFASPLIQKLLKPVALPARGLAFGDFTACSPLMIDGELAVTLDRGGAYEKPELPAAHIKRMALDVCAAWFKDRYEDIEAWISHKAWCDFFLDVAWDFTCVVLDKGQRRIHVICATDTD